MVRNKFSRPQKQREIGAKLIIVCEGETEEVYFNAIRITKRLQTLKIKVINPEFTDPENIVKYAIKLRNEAKKEKNWQPEDEAWAVYDGDEHKVKDENNWKRAIDLANKEDIKLGISNPSFELWFLLHYQDQNANIHRNVTNRRLKEHLPTYIKTNDFYESDFKQNTRLAIERALNISERIERDLLEKYSNPSTEIYLLVNRLLEL